MDVSSNKLWEMVTDRETQHAAGHGVTESDTTEQLTYLTSLPSVRFLKVQGLHCVWQIPLAIPMVSTHAPPISVSLSSFCHSSDLRVHGEQAHVWLACLPGPKYFSDCMLC